MSRESEEYKVHFIKAEFPILNEKEVRAYLEFSGWVLSKALDELKDDLSWERANTKENRLAISSIREKMKVIKAVKKSRLLQQKKQARVKLQKYDREPLLVVGLPLSFNAVKSDVNRTIRYNTHANARAHLHSEFGIELKDLSNACSTGTYCV